MLSITTSKSVNGTMAIGDVRGAYIRMQDGVPVSCEIIYNATIDGNLSVQTVNVDVTPDIAAAIKSLIFEPTVDAVAASEDIGTVSIAVDVVKP